MSVKTHKVSFKQGTVLATLLGCSALYLPLAAEAATASAKTSWAVSRVASESLGSYCTMAQKYSDDTVLTFAQNTKGEYSLALDFKNQKFTGGKKQSISIGMDGGKAKSFDVVPQTDKTAVIGIGKDSDFVQRISSAGQLAIKIGADTSTFGVTEFAAGQKEMGSCIDALQQPSEKPAEKTVAKSGQPVIHKNEIAMKPAEVNSATEPSVEGLLAAMPKPSADITPIQEDIIPVSPVKSKLDSKSDKGASLQVEVASLREENARLSRALSEQRKSFEDKQLNSDGAALNEMREKLEAAKAENQSLTSQLGKMNAKGPSSKESAESAKLAETVQALQQENQTLKNQIQIYATTKDSKSANNELLAKLQSENADLKQAIADLKTAPKASTSVAAVSDDEVNKLRADNRKLNNELDLVKTEKSTLQTQATNLQKDLESKQLKMSGGSWDLEQATRRYQESQREIVRLGSIIQAQDVKCANEKKDIEYMLFDPAIATKAQIAMLNSMEDQIKEKDGKLKSAEAELTSAKTQASPDKDARIADLQKAVAQAQVELAEKTQLLADAHVKIQKGQVNQADVAAKDKDMAALKADLAQKSQQLADAQSKIQQAQATDKDMVALKADLAQKSQQLTEAQSKIQQAQATDKDMIALKTDLAQKSQQLAEAQSRVQQAQVAQTDLIGKNQTLLSMQSDLALKTQQLADAQAKLQQANQSQLAVSTQKDSELVDVKKQLAQVQAQLATEQAAAQKIDVKAQAQQSAEQAASIASLQLQVQQANHTIIQLQNQISANNQAALKSASIAASAAAVAPAAASTPMVQQASYAPQAAAVSPVAQFKSIEEFSTLLKNAGVSVRGALQQVKGGDPSSYRAYSWKTDNLYGSAEMRKVADASQFDAAVNQYLGRAKSRCSGEFAAVPSPVKAPAMAQSRAYEIACVGQSSSSSASVLFTYGNQITTIIAHEGRAEAMDLAIDARDKVSSKMN